jgi:hypothetical protein
MVVCLHSMKCVAYPALFSAVLVVSLPALFSLPPASSCPLQLWRAASSAWTPQLQTTAVEELVAGPWVGSLEELGLTVEDLGMVGEESWLPEEADLCGVSTWAGYGSTE